jgi:hypothetical protein
LLRLSLFFMVGLTVAIAIGLRWREERVAAAKPPQRGRTRPDWLGQQKKKLNRWVTAAALAAVVTLLFLGGINWLRVWRGS